MKESYESLLSKISSTRNSRFEAYRRNQKLQLLSTYGLAGLSSGTIFLSFFVTINSNQKANILLGFIGALASLFILMLSLIDGSRDYSLKSYLFHKCALELGPLCILLKKQIDKQDFDEVKFDSIDKEYQNILENFQLNHSQSDYTLYTLKYPEYIHSKDLLKSSLIRWFLMLILDIKVYFLYYAIIVFLIASFIAFLYFYGIDLMADVG